MKKYIIIGILIGLLAVVAMAGGYSDYKTRSLSNALHSFTDLSDERIEYLLTLPQKPELKEYRINMIKMVDITGEWLYIDEGETKCIYFNECSGEVIYNLNK